MAMFMIPYNAKVSTEETGGGGHYQNDTIQYGNLTAISLASFDYTAYLEFDLGQAMRSIVTSVTLIRQRDSLTGTGDPGATSINYTISVFVSAIPEIPQQLPNTNNLANVGGILPVKGDTQTSGTISTDITSIFPITSAVSGIMGLKLNGDYPRSGYATDSSAYLVIIGTPLPALAQENLSPIEARNPRSSIDFSWTHTPNPSLLMDDPQTSSQIEISHPEHTMVTQTISGTTNAFVLPAFTFAGINDHGPYQPASFRVRTQTQYNGWGAWSNPIMLPLAPTPPLAPELIFPLGVSVNAAAGVLLEFSYRSIYDTKPTRFDVRYRLDGGTWINKTNSGELSVMTDPIEGQWDVEWQAMAYGALEDAGPWSAIATFFSIGQPHTPVITNVSNSNRPTVTFTARKPLSWEMEFLQNGVIIYSVTTQPFIGYSYQVDELLNSGDYIARMRIANQYGLKSEWAAYSFSINTVPPTPLMLEVTSDLDFFIRLYFYNPENKTVYVYRGMAGNDDFIRIAKLTSGSYDDYTASPNLRYRYFIRVVNSDYSFADSNTVLGWTDFPQSVIARASQKDDIVKLNWQIGSKPTKDRSHSYEKSFVQFVGRRNPITLIGDFVTKSISLSFCIDAAERDKLENFNEAYDTLIYRDRRHGTLFCQIDGDIVDSPASTNMDEFRENLTVSFTIRQTDWNETVPL